MKTTTSTRSLALFQQWLSDQIQSLQLTQEEPLPIQDLLKEAQKKPFTGLFDLYRDLKREKKIK